MTGAKSITAYDIHHIESFHDIPMISGREIMNAYSQVKGEYDFLLKLLCLSLKHDRDEQH